MLSPTNSTLSAADMILLYTKINQYLIHDSYSLLGRKICIFLLVGRHRPPIWPPALPLIVTFIFFSYLGTVPGESAIYKLLKFTCAKSHIFIPSLSSFIERIHPSPSLFLNCSDNLIFYGEGLLAIRPTYYFEDHPLSAVRGWKICSH
jgi:hypothetical protein